MISGNCSIRPGIMVNEIIRIGESSVKTTRIAERVLEIRYFSKRNMNGKKALASIAATKIMSRIEDSRQVR